MGDFPFRLKNCPPGPIITPFSKESIGPDVLRYGGSVVSGIYPTANKALYFPFVVEEPITITQLGWLNGGTVSGNVDAGIYDYPTYTKQISTGSVAQATINTPQITDVADTPLQPGQYYLAISCDNTTATFFRLALPTVALFYRALGVQEQATAFALPATATPVGTTTGSVPLVFATRKTVI